MASTVTKMVKKADPEIWRQFRGYCIARGIRMGPAIGALMKEVVAGRLSLTDGGDNEVIMRRRKGR